MRPPFAGHGGQLLNRSLATTTKKYFLQRNQYFFEPSPWHTEEPAPAQTSRAPPYSPHRLSIEGIGSRTTVSVRMKSLFWEYLGQSGVFVGKKTKGGGEEEDWTYCPHPNRLGRGVSRAEYPHEARSLSRGDSRAQSLARSLLCGVSFVESLARSLSRALGRSLLRGKESLARRGEGGGEDAINVRAVGGT